MTIEESKTSLVKNKVVYLRSNGVHVDFVLPYSSLSPELKKLNEPSDIASYISFGWGDKNFYLNTPTWSDLTLKTTLKALFWKSETLIHLTRYSQTESTWKKIPISMQQEKLLVNYI